MKVVIAHDSGYGNGEKVAQIFRKVLEEADNSVTVAHVKNLDPQAAAVERPDLLILGGAIRKFRSSPASKRWLKDFAREAESVGTLPRFAAVYLTHGLPLSWAGGWGRRFRRRLVRSNVAEQIYPDWLSGKVSAPEGPLDQGVAEALEGNAHALLNWVSSRQSQA